MNIKNLKKLTKTEIKHFVNKINEKRKNNMTENKEIAEVKNEIEEVTEVTEVEQVEEVKNDFEEENKALKDEIASLKNELKKYNEQKEQEEKDVKILNLVNEAVKSGKLTEKQKANWINLAKLDFETVKNSLESLPNAIKATRTADVVKNMKGDDTSSEINLFELSKKDPKKVQDLYINNRAEFDRLYQKTIKKSA